MDSRKVYTTGQIARICHVAPRTVAKWFDSERLKGYRVPGSGDRRVTRESLLAFMREHGMPVGAVVGGMYHNVLLVSVEKKLADSLTTKLNPDSGYNLLSVGDLFTAGMEFQDGHYSVVVFGRSVGREVVYAAAPTVHSHNGGFRSQLVYLANEDLTQDQAQKLFPHGGGVAVQGPHSADVVAKLVADRTTRLGPANGKKERHSLVFCPAGGWEEG